MLPTINNILPSPVNISPISFILKQAEVSYQPPHLSDYPKSTIIRSSRVPIEPAGSSRPDFIGTHDDKFIFGHPEEEKFFKLAWSRHATLQISPADY